MLKVKFASSGKKQKTEEEINIDEFIGIKGFKAKGKRVSTHEIEDMEWMEPLIDEQPIKEEVYTDDAENGHKQNNKESENKNTSNEGPVKKHDGYDTEGPQQITLDFDS